MKYSCCLYPTGTETLDEAEELMLESYCVKAKLEDGMDMLDLGCGWGSLTLFLAKARLVLSSHLLKRRPGANLTLCAPEIPQIAHHEPVQLGDAEAPH